MKNIEWVNPNRMKISTGHATFDRACRVVCRGNAVTDTQVSSYIRAFDHVQMPMAGLPDREPGYLQDFDLQYFDLPEHVERRVRELARHESVILYQLFHYVGRTRTDHGFLITSTDHQELARFYTGPTHKSEGVMDTAAEYLVA